MLPESGARADFKLAIMRCVTTAPLPGEQYSVDDAAKIISSIGRMLPGILTVTHICGDVHFQLECGGVRTDVLVFAFKWRAWREAGIVKFIGYDQ